MKRLKVIDLFPLSRIEEETRHATADHYVKSELFRAVLEIALKYEKELHKNGLLEKER